MTAAEKTLYHQIHPLKLGTDISFSIISLYFLWEHQLGLALCLHILPPIIASFFVIKYVNLDRQKNSAFGRYVKKHMSNGVVAARLAGDIITVFSAWYHEPLLIVLGLGIVLLAFAHKANLRALQFAFRRVP
jgi:hypothetical protein